MAEPYNSTTFQSDPSYDDVEDELERMGRRDPSALPPIYTAALPPAYTDTVARQAPTSSSSNHDTKYADSHVVVDATARTITIKHWLLSHPVLVVPIDKVIYILPAAQATTPWALMGFGSGASRVGWARDFHRVLPNCMLPMGKAYKSSFVMKWEGSDVRAGFTVEKKDEFLRALEAVRLGVTTRTMDEGPTLM